MEVKINNEELIEEECNLTESDLKLQELDEIIFEEYDELFRRLAHH